MKLNIPEQSAPSKDDFPNHPRKVKKWLAELKRANMGEFTRQIYNNLMKLNRQSMSVKHRLEDMEMLREPTRHIFLHLHKHFINRTLPLPAKSLKIVNLSQALLAEMAIGYKIIIFEAANDLSKVDNKTFMTACERSLHYLSEMLLRASQVYTAAPKGIWWDIHHIYAYAEQKNLHVKKVKDNEAINQTTTVENYYKHILLFSLSRPNALRQSDAERVYKCLADWANQTTLSANPVSNKLNRYFCSRINTDMPPNCISEEDLKGLNNIRAIDTDDLVKSLKPHLSNESSFNSTMAIGDQVSQETLRTLMISWSLCAKRRFSRASREGDIKVAIGLSTIFQTLTKEAEPPSKAKEKKPGHMFSLESISDTHRADKDIFAQQDSSFFITHPNMKAEQDSSADAWDMVAKGRALTETYAQELQTQHDEMGEIHKENPDIHWKISNVSAGGYCLQWDSDHPSKAQVGEIIAVREKEPDHTYQWRVGVIRWMQFTHKNGLEIGVQVLSPKLITCTVRRLKRKDEAPFECLMLPGIKPIQQPSTLLLPAHAFKKNDVLSIFVYERDIDIKLGSIREHTGSFTQFQFSQLTDTGDTEKKEEKKKSSPDNFDSIWSSI